MAFITLATGDGHLESVMFSNVLSAYDKLVRKNSTLLFAVKKQDDFNCIIESVKKIE